jgi:UDP-glucose 4-epimerase
MPSRVTLITGVADHWGQRLAQRLLTEPDITVIGLDTEPPKVETAGLDFIQADVQNPVLADLLRSENVKVVCHTTSIYGMLPNQGGFARNVMGTRRLLEACAEASVDKVVLRSSTLVYGAHPNNPALLGEQASLRGSQRYGYIRHFIEIEKYCAGFAHLAPELKVTVLRLANVIGPTVDTPMTRFLKNRWAPTLLGFDPMLQLIHEDDAIEALAHATLHDRPGTFNVASPGAMPLSQIVALSGGFRILIFHPLAYWRTQKWMNSGSALGGLIPFPPDYVRYSWVGDLTRMQEMLGFEPSYSAKEALREFSIFFRPRGHGPDPDALATDEEGLRATLERRRRARERQATTPVSATPVKGDLDE